MAFTITLFVLFTLILFLVGRRYSDKRVLIFVISGWVLKCIAGLTFIYVYTFHYGNGELSEDSGAYLREAKKLVEIKKTNSSDYYSILFDRENCEELIAKHFHEIQNSRISRQISGINDTRIHIKGISLLMLLIGENQNAIFLLFFFLSYLGFIILWLSIKDKVNLHPAFSFGLLLLPPNLLFWTSSNLKEPIYILGLCLILAYCFSEKKKLSSIIMVSLGLLLLLFFKPILLVILIVSWLLWQLIYRAIVLKQRIYWVFLIGGISLLFIFSVPKKALRSLSERQFDFINIARGGIQVKGDTSFYYIASPYKNKIQIVDSIVYLKESIPAVSNLFGKIRSEKTVILQPNREKLKLVYLQTSGSSYFEIIPINNNWLNLMKAWPEALMNTFFRPYFWQNGFSIFSFFFFVENLLFLGLFIYALSHVNKLNRWHSNFFYYSMLSIIILAFIIGITTPVSGALIRYRIPIQLLIIIVFLLTRIRNEHAK